MSHQKIQNSGPFNVWEGNWEEKKIICKKAREEIKRSVDPRGGMEGRASNEVWGGAATGGGPGTRTD